MQEKEVRPSYYTNKGDFEPFKLFERYNLTNYYLNTAIAYLARPDKPSNSRIQDFRKAITFLRIYQRLGGGRSVQFKDETFAADLRNNLSTDLCAAWKLPVVNTSKFVSNLFGGLTPNAYNSVIDTIEEMLQGMEQAEASTTIETRLLKSTANLEPSDLPAFRIIFVKGATYVEDHNKDGSEKRELELWHQWIGNNITVKNGKLLHKDRYLTKHLNARAHVTLSRKTLDERRNSRKIVEYKLKLMFGLCPIVK